jgi:hypothetical protein
MFSTQISNKEDGGATLILRPADPLVAKTGDQNSVSLSVRAECGR